MMLQVTAQIPAAGIEAALRRAARGRNATIVSSIHVGHAAGPGPAHRAVAYSVCSPELYEALLEADVRLSALLPCRIAAWPEGERTVLATVPPSEFCRIIRRPDLIPLAEPLEALLAGILEDASQPAAAGARAAASSRGALGATEDQMNQRGLVPQRIDCRGTKVEDLAGTGQPEAQGG